MDSLTQIVLGASVQGAILGKFQGRKAYLYGAMLGTLPDLDVLLPYPDPISSMTYHRGFSHSVFVLIAAGLLMTTLIGQYYRYKGTTLPYSKLRLALALTLALVTHPILDSFTVYGTQLFWPIPTTPISIASVFIIDPLYTLPLLIAMICGLIKGCALTTIDIPKLMQCQRLALWMLVISSGYLLLSVGLKSYAQTQAYRTLIAADIYPERIKTIPMLPTTLLWRSIVQDQNDQIIEVRGSIFDSRLPEFRHLSQYDQSMAIKRQLPKASRPYADRLDWFTHHWSKYRIQSQAAGAKSQLVVDDLRMMADQIPFFSFVLATKPQDDHTTSIKQWHAITPNTAPPPPRLNDKGPTSRLALVKQSFWRLIDQSQVDTAAGWQLPPVPKNNNRSH